MTLSRPLPHQETGTLQLRTISVVVDPITRLRIRLWP